MKKHYCDLCEREVPLREIVDDDMAVMFRMKLPRKDQCDVKVTIYAENADYNRTEIPDLCLECVAAKLQEVIANPAQAVYDDSDD